MNFRLLIFCLFSVCSPLCAQVGIGTSAPDVSSILDLSSSSKGILMPRMSQTNRNLIGTPAMGLVVYNTTTNQYNYFDGSVWKNLSGISGSGSNNYIPKWTGSSLTNSQIVDDGTNVSIGVGSPVTKLNTSNGIAVLNSTDGFLLTQNTQIADGYFNINYDTDVLGTGKPSATLLFNPRNNGNTGTSTTAAIAMQKKPNNNEGFIAFSTRDYYNVLDERVRIDGVAVKIGGITPMALSVSSDKFLVDSLGNIRKINGIATDFPLAQGVANSVLLNNGLGGLTWVPSASLDATTASNGLSLFGKDIRLGGAMNSNTTITKNSSSFTIDQSGTGDFQINNAGTPNLVVKSGVPQVGVGISAPTAILHVNDPNNAQGSIRITAGSITGTSNADGLSLSINSIATNILSYENTPMNFGVNGTNKMTLNPNGYLGLGTTNPSSTFHNTGSIARNYRIIPASSTLLDTDDILIIQSGSGTLTLPSPSSCNGRVYTLVNLTSSSIGFSMPYIDLNNSSNSNMPSYSSISILSTGSNWVRIQ